MPRNSPFDQGCHKGPGPRRAGAWCHLRSTLTPPMFMFTVVPLDRSFSVLRVTVLPVTWLPVLASMVVF